MNKYYAMNIFYEMYFYLIIYSMHWKYSINWKYAMNWIYAKKWKYSMNWIYWDSTEIKIFELNCWKVAAQAPEPDIPKDLSVHINSIMIWTFDVKFS